MALKSKMVSRYMSNDGHCFSQMWGSFTLENVQTKLNMKRWVPVQELKLAMMQMTQTKK